ncbi:DNA polymerase IV [Candidatus Bilamarchaeum dharawalense]|uniref:DNA-directed DNA polymerase n=1 Tax=Candidatus Bilamarchaeum dharawalense TaxID=2885759 RepID=A0A5E4LRM4_9ARCH|nr:DNA polymerase IV [Candidatus Bilamarchaeum dharawalense]
MYLHLDMDYFFAQLEEKRRPMAKNKIIVVCVYSGRTEDSGVVSTVNYLGREIGIHSGMPIAFAKKRAPPADSIFVPIDREYYEQTSLRLDQIIRRSCDRVVQASIDEWNVEDKNAIDKAARLKDSIKNELGLTCSVGVAPSILGAKMAASKSKPNGLLILDKSEERRFIDESSLEKVPGIGPKTVAALNQIGAAKVKDLRNISVVTLAEIFGRKTGGWLHNLSSGNFDQDIGEEKPQDEVSRIGTLKESTRDSYLLLSKLTELENEAKEWLMNMKKSYKTLSITFITEDLKTHTKSTSFRNPKSWNEDISKDMEALVSEFLSENNMEIRRIGIRFANFMDMDCQTTLF